MVANTRDHFLGRLPMAAGFVSVALSKVKPCGFEVAISKMQHHSAASADSKRLGYLVLGAPVVAPESVQFRTGKQTARQLMDGPRLSQPVHGTVQELHCLSSTIFGR